MSKPELICSRQYDKRMSYAALCCSHVFFEFKLIRPTIKSEEIIVESKRCPHCQKHLVYGVTDGKKSILKCGDEQLGKILSMFNQKCILENPFGTRFQEVGKVWYVRIFKKRYCNDADYYIVPFDKPELSCSCMHFKCDNDFHNHMKLID